MCTFAGLDGAFSVEQGSSTYDTSRPTPCPVWEASQLSVFDELDQTVLDVTARTNSKTMARDSRSIELRATPVCQGEQRMEASLSVLQPFHHEARGIRRARGRAAKLRMQLT